MYILIAIYGLTKINPLGSTNAPVHFAGFFHIEAKYEYAYRERALLTSTRQNSSDADRDAGVKNAV